MRIRKNHHGSPLMKDALVCIATLLLGACTVFLSRPVTPISEVINDSKGAQSDRAIDRMRTTKTSYALRGSDYGKLADAGVPDKVLDHLQQTFYDEVDLLTRHWVLGGSLGGCDRCYPQPLDLSNLASGGDGMAGAHNLGRHSTYAKPQGLPDWITPFSGKMRARGITVVQVAQMVREGKPVNDVVAEIENSRMHDFIDTSGGISNISTHYSVGLRGSKLAQLHADGVPDPALDALQKKALAEFIEFHRIRYQSLGKGQK